jgi:hypothetical protein
MTPLLSLLLSSGEIGSPCDERLGPDLGGPGTT